MEPAADGPELVDTSVWARSGRPGLEWFAAAVEDGRVAVCDQIVMELRWSARDHVDFRATETARHSTAAVRDRPGAGRSPVAA